MGFANSKKKAVVVVLILTVLCLHICYRSKYEKDNRNLRKITAFAVIVLITAIFSVIPHFAIICGIIFAVGTVGGINYANTFYHIHRKVDPGIREFALSTVTFADTVGILAAAVAAIPTHNWICAVQ
ncbi:hypothetical protein DICVIV_05595 [Dictyocaulus viviparus]|uniref:Battenin n=1 Tax=Dictyocaulus viviparus TaxID=29172 RepID=A0A0D8Y110_DICVI|nr:hypothetical protein DICVIV_05595 [Dictyocaulus viviparus]